jgi:hypothetical protein
MAYFEVLNVRPATARQTADTARSSPASVATRVVQIVRVELNRSRLSRIGQFDSHRQDRI